MNFLVKEVSVGGTFHCLYNINPYHTEFISGCIRIYLNLIFHFSTQRLHRKMNPSSSWWRHQMETFSALLAISAGNSLVTGEFPAQRPVVRSFDVFFDLRLNEWLSKQSWGWWFETPSCPLWRHIIWKARTHLSCMVSKMADDTPVTCVTRPPAVIDQFILGYSYFNTRRGYM